MRNKLIYFTPLILALAAGCGKEEPAVQQYSDEHRFFVKGKANGLPFSFYAGKDHYFLDTHYALRDSALEMTARLSRPDQPKREAFEITVRGAQILERTDDFVPEQNLQSGHLALRDLTGFNAPGDRYTIELSCDSTASNYNSHRWDFPDGGFNKIDYYLEKEVSLSEFPVYPVKLTTRGAFGCETSVTHHIDLKADCDANFDLQVGANFSVNLRLTNVVGAVNEVHWTLNGQPVNANPQGQIYLSNTGNPHVIGCRVIFDSGCEKYIERELSGNFNNDCQAEFYYHKKADTQYDPLQLATVEVNYYDKQGKKFTSLYNDVKGQFKIVSVTPFGENPQGMATTRFFFEADAVLKSEDGNTLNLQETFGSFALAHP